MYMPIPVPVGHTETLQLTVIPQVLAWYIQYQHIYSTDIYSPNGSVKRLFCFENPMGCCRKYTLIDWLNGWQHISNTNIYFHKCTFSTLCPKGIQKPSNCNTVIPQVLAWYIQYQHIYSTDIYSPNGWKHISNTNIYFHKCTFPTLCPKGIQTPSNLHSNHSQALST